MLYKVRKYNQIHTYKKCKQIDHMQANIHTKSLMIKSYFNKQWNHGVFQRLNHIDSFHICAKQIQLSSHICANNDRKCKQLEHMQINTSTFFLG